MRALASVCLTVALAVPAPLASAQGFELSAPLAREVLGDVYTEVVSADGTRVVFAARQQGSSNRDLFSAPVGGGSVARLTPDVPELYVNNDFLPRISPDSLNVAYWRAGLFCVPIDGGQSLRLTPVGDESFVSLIRFSPDSSRVVYLRQTGGFLLHSVPVAGGSPTQLAGEGVFSFVITPDSSRVVYMSLASPRRLYSVPIDGGTPLRLDATNRAVSEFSLSPDGTRVVYRADQDTAGVFELYSVPVGGGTPVELNGPLVAGGDVVAVYPNPEGPVISPDGTRVVYAADQETDEVVELYSVPIAGGPVVKLNGPLVTGGDVLVSYGLGNDYVVSPDSSRVLYLADQELDGKIELYSVPIAGGATVKLSGTLASDQDVFSMEISPDSSRVVYVDSVGLHSVPVGSGPPVTLAQASDAAFSGPLFSTDSTRVVYRLSIGVLTDPPDTHYELYSVPIAGGSPVRIDSPSLHEPYLRNRLLTFLLAGPDHVVYRAAQDLYDVDELYSVTLDGGTTAKLNPPLLAEGAVVGDVTAVVVSDDGSRVAYRADQDYDETFELYGVRVLEHAPEKLSSPLVRGGDVTSFSLTSDGESLIYVADQEVDERFELYGRPFGGPAPAKISGTLVAGGDVASASFSPSETWVVYLADQDIDEVFELYGTTGGPAAKLHEPLAAGRLVLGPPLFALDEYLVYRVQDTVGNTTELRSVPLAGGPSILLSLPLVGGRHVTRCAVSADGSSVVYVADAQVDNRFELYRVSVSGGASIKLNGPLVLTGDVLDFEIRPDGLGVAYRADQDTNELLELYAAPILGGSFAKLNGPLVAGGGVDFYDFAPDSSRLVYVARQESLTRALYSVPAAGGAAIRLDGPGSAISAHQIDPDSARVVYRQASGALNSAPIGGGTPTTLVPAALGPGQFAVTPDASAVLYSAQSFHSGALFQIPITGGTSKRVGADLAGELRTIEFAGDRVFYIADQDPSEVALELFLGFQTRPHRRH